MNKLSVMALLLGMVASGSLMYAIATEYKGILMVTLISFALLMIIIGSMTNERT